MKVCLWLKTWSVLGNVLYELEKNEFSAVWGAILYIYLLSLFDQMCPLKKNFEAMLWGLWDISALIRNWTRAPCSGITDHWTTREVPNESFFGQCILVDFLSGSCKWHVKVLLYSYTITQLLISPFKSINICFIYLYPSFGAYIFTNVHLLTGLTLLF